MKTVRPKVRCRVRTSSSKSPAPIASRPDFGSQAHHDELGHHDLVEQPLRKVEIFAHRKLDVLTHRQRRKQRPLLKQDAPAALDPAPGHGIGLVEIDAKDFY